MRAPRPRRVAELLGAVLPGLAGRVELDAIAAAWPGLVGAALAGHARPRGLVDGVLQVVVDSPAWRQELTLRSAELTALVRARFPSVSAVSSVFGRLPERPPATPFSEGRAPRRELGEGERREIETAIAGIVDRDARDAARRLWITARSRAVAPPAVSSATSRAAGPPDALHPTPAASAPEVHQ